MPGVNPLIPGLTRANSNNPNVSISKIAIIDRRSFIQDAPGNQTTIGRITILELRDDPPPPI